MIEAWIDLAATRLSDALNRRVPIDIHYSLDGRPQALATDDVIALALQAHPIPSPNRVARRRHTLQMTAPPDRLRGIVHMPAGANPDQYLRATSQRWTALTDATIATIGGDGGYESEVLLVNMDHVIRR